jgi:aminoglycoside phosphotransferase (APT) family kinase protein
MLEASGREAMVADLADVLSYLHSFDIDQARGLGVPETDYAFPMRDDYLLTGDAPALYQDDLTAFSASGVADVEVLNVLRTLLDRYLARTENRRGRVALLHNEVSGDHVLVDASGRVTGIIDLNGMILGPAVRDFLYLYELLGTSFVREVIKAYGLLDPEEALEDLQFLHVWHTLLRLLWAIEHRFERGIVERSRALRTLCTPAS